MKPLLTVKELCSEVGISRPKFYLMCSEGKGPRITKIGSRTLIKSTDYEQWASGLPSQDRPDPPRARRAA